MCLTLFDIVVFWLARQNKHWRLCARYVTTGTGRKAPRGRFLRIDPSLL